MTPLARLRRALLLGCADLLRRWASALGQAALSGVEDADGGATESPPPEGAGGPGSSAGPPAHWVDYVRRRAPHWLSADFAAPLGSRRAAFEPEDYKIGTRARPPQPRRSAPAPTAADPGIAVAPADAQRDSGPLQAPAAPHTLTPMSSPAIPLGTDLAPPLPSPRRRSVQPPIEKPGITPDPTSHPAGRKAIEDGPERRACSSGSPAFTAVSGARADQAKPDHATGSTSHPSQPAEAPPGPNHPPQHEAAPVSAIQPLAVVPLPIPPGAVVDAADRPARERTPPILARDPNPGHPPRIRRSRPTDFGDAPPASAAAPGCVPPAARAEGWLPRYTPRRPARPEGQSDPAVAMGRAAGPDAPGRGFFTDAMADKVGGWPALPDEFATKPEDRGEAADRWPSLPPAEAASAGGEFGAGSWGWADRHRDAERSRFLEREQRGIQWSESPF